mgnify:CR=1 FL=1
MHKKIKITVLRAEYDQELAEQYAIPNLEMCPFHQKGQVLYSDGINPPDGMCGAAWQVLFADRLLAMRRLTRLGMMKN